MTNELTFNGVQYDLTNKDDVQKALDAIEEHMNNFGFNGLAILLKPVYVKLINSFKEIKQGLEKEEEEVDWEALGIDWERDSHCIADTYLSTIPGYEDQAPEVQARQIKTLADFYEWLDSDDED